MQRFFRGNGVSLILFIILAANVIVSGNFLDNPLQWVIRTLLLLPGIVIGITVHEFAHAFVAYKLGDATPKFQRRVTLNPLAHIEPIGIVALLLVGFGWGRPVQVNPYAFRKNPRLCNLLVDIAGVVTNLIFAILFTGIMWLMFEFTPAGIVNGSVIYYVLMIVNNIIFMNLVLMIFNLLPIPPLDGFGIITEIFNLRGKPIYNRIYSAGFPILLVLIIFKVPSLVISPVIDVCYNLIMRVFFP